MTARPEQHTEPAPAREAPAVIHLPPPPIDTSRPKARSGSTRRQRQDGVFVRLLPAEKVRLSQEAPAGMSVAGYLRSGRLGDEAAGPRTRRRAPVDEEALLRGLVAFNRGNSNLNQIARTLNTLTLFAEEHGAARMVELLDELRRPVELLQEQFAAPVAAIMGALGHDC